MERLILAVLIGAVCVLVMLLLNLKHSVTRYAQYWHKRALQPGAVRYVVLGDSTGQSIGASAPDKGYVGLIATLLERTTNQTVQVINRSVSGARLRDVLDTQCQFTADQQADFVTLAIGANNIKTFDEQTFRKEFIAILKHIPKYTIVATIAYFGGRVRSNDQVIVANKIIVSEATKRGFQIADVYQVTKNAQSIRNYAVDVFHPSDRGYRLWYRAFEQLLK